MPPWPMTRSFGKPEASSATWHIASMGFAKMTSTAFGECCTAFFTTVRTMPAFMYVLFSALGVLFTLIGSYVGERIQLGPEAKSTD